MSRSAFKRLRLVLADDHEIVRRGLRATLEEQPGWTVIGEAGNGREAVELVKRLKPDLAILDLVMPELNGLEATRQIKKAVPGVEILILTMHESEQLVREVLAAGARGYVLKNDAGRVLLHAVEALSQHKPFFTSKVAEIVLNEYLRPTEPSLNGSESSRLTSREREILQLIAEGKANKEIAEALGIAVRTTETHRANLMRKLDLHTASDLTRYAIRNKIVEA
ncbi:MAG: response regulator transcription factor [Verrucomicrobia bacterium]|nr:response regulator transcription factor [Verrucomicrobiota bacterium]